MVTKADHIDLVAFGEISAVSEKIENNISLLNKGMILFRINIFILGRLMPLLPFPHQSISI